jgi:hemerythrin-like domain-containing protein
MRISPGVLIQRNADDGSAPTMARTRGCARPAVIGRRGRADHLLERLETAMSAMPATLRIIRDEHAALAALLRTMALVVADARRHNRVPDFRALRAMLFYVDEFPERLHHVKESTLLFPRLRACTVDADAVLARLDRDHASGASRVRDLEHKLIAWEMLGESRRAAFEFALDQYVSFYLDHMRVEETEVLPLAERVFDDRDWPILDREFGANGDPLTGVAPEAPYDELFRTIVAITPAPYGVGEPLPDARR